MTLNNADMRDKTPARCASECLCIQRFIQKGLGSRVYNMCAIVCEQELFDYLDDPNNADMHEIMPNKFVAFKGPKMVTKFHEGS